MINHSHDAANMDGAKAGAVTSDNESHDIHQRLWRSLDELADTPEFIEHLQREFPRQIGEWADPNGRRNFLKLMAASFGLAGIGINGCLHQPEEKIVPYVRQPEDFVPGKPLFFATCMTLGGYATGVLVESHLGRPTKIEGNPEHPASLGATDAFTQASILTMYDPDRSQSVMKEGYISTWGEFLTQLSSELPALRGRQGKGLAILTETVTSPTLADQLRQLLKDLPQAKWHQYEPAGRDNVRRGAKLAFGEYVDTIFHFDKAEVILALDCEFMHGMPGSVRYTRDFVDQRRVSQPDEKDAGSARRENRLYAIESTPGLTGAMADHRLPLQASKIEDLARALAKRLGIEVAGEESVPDSIPAAWLTALLSDLQCHKGTSLVIVGDGQSATVHALAHAINRQLENVGKTLMYIPPVEVEPTDQLTSLTQLTDAMRQGDVELLLVLGGNPVHNAPGEIDFLKHFDRCKFRVHLSEYYDETSFASHWHIPAAHYLESWGDARAYDGTASLQQPLIAPLYGGRTALDILAAVAGHAERTAYETVQTYWKQQLGVDGFDKKWRKAVHDGVVPETAAATHNVKWEFADPGRKDDSTDDEKGIEVNFIPDPTIWDGRFANNGWLQELPKPLTKLTWDNAALIDLSTAKRLGLANYDVVELSLAGRSIHAPIWIVPGHARDSITLTLGYGRTHCGRVGNGVGINVSPLRPAQSPWFARGVALKKTGESHKLVVTQNHYSMEGRNLVQIGTVAQLDRPDEIVDPKTRHPENQPSLYPKYEESENAWGMVIDQTACIGCNACVIACQAENNIPIVGREQVDIGREMQWLRIDRYYKGEIDNPETYFQPIACMHCEDAPCELVCPVAATVHSHEGLNQMVYNRCVGTRYCSNNCPYKVRRFNFLNYDKELGNDAEHAPSLKLQRNPDVTVRSRGVMEKCTYCVQRINSAKIDAQKQNRPVRDGEIVTACQGACPAQAIVFGNLRDKSSHVTKTKASPLNYSLLAELNTLPRTTYLARIRNPHPDLAFPAEADTPPIVPTELDRFERSTL
jgi:MoCo/4Fe-4S cofactor protein with predicted Tat translocation signal